LSKVVFKKEKKQAGMKRGVFKSFPLEFPLLKRRCAELVEVRAREVFFTCSF
jgi:hypothetical protein